MVENMVEKAAKQLRDATANKIVCKPVRELIGESDIVQAYTVQDINTEIRLAEGAKIIGSKIGLTSLSVQQQFGISQPDFGMLFDDKEVWNGGEISIREIMQPRAEAEIAFVLGKDLEEENITTTKVLSAIEYALACIELVGSRIENWDIKITDTIADNASASHFVLGHKPVKLENLDLINGKMILEKNGELASKGAGSACLGSPINAMLWLAKTMQRLGRPMRAGDLIMTGALGPMVNIVAGDHFRAEIEGLGEVSVKFTV